MATTIFSIFACSFFRVDKLNISFYRYYFSNFSKDGLIIFYISHEFTTIITKGDTIKDLTLYSYGLNLKSLSYKDNENANGIKKH